MMKGQELIHHLEVIALIGVSAAQGSEVARQQVDKIGLPTEHAQLVGFIKGLKYAHDMLIGGSQEYSQLKW